MRMKIFGNTLKL